MNISEELKIRALITESDRYSLKIITRLFQKFEHIKLTGVATNEEDIINYLNHTAVDIILLDIGMKKLNSPRLINFLTDNYPRLKIIIYSDFSCEQSLIKYAYDKGIPGFISKEANLKELVTAIESINSGFTYIDVRLNDIIQTQYEFA